MDIHRGARQYVNGTRLQSIQSLPETVKPLSYISLFKYTTKGERACIGFGIILAILSGCIPPIVNILYGQYCNLMIARQFPSEVPLKEAGIIQWFGGGRTLVNASSAERKQALQNDAVAWGISCACFSFLQFLFSLFSVFSLCHMATRQVSRIKILFFQSILCKDLSWFDTKMSGSFAGQISENLHLIEKVTGDVLSVCTYQLTIGLVNIVTCFTFGWLLTLVLFFAVIPVSAIAFFKGKIQSKLAVKEIESNAKAGNVAEEVFASIKTVVAFEGEQNEVKRYENNLKETRGYVTQRGIVSGVSNGVSWFIIYVSYAIAFIYGVRLIHSSIEKGDFTYTPAVLLIVFFGMVTALTNLGFATTHFDTFSLASGAATFVFDVINTKCTINSCSGEGATGTDCHGEIEFRDVHFEYPARRSVRILRGVNFKINPGEIVAIVGHSGTGKTTIVHLVQRLYDPSKGAVFLDGQNINTLKLSWLREQLAVVNQEPLLFNASILQNIRFGNMSATDAEVEQAAIKANAHDFIMKLREGYNTIIGQRGSNLSGGQKQRIAIARALIRNPKILILDEPVSALDSASEKIVLAAVNKASEGRTTLIITHKISTIVNAHRILVLQDGVVAEEGTHNELVRANGIYKQLLQVHAENIQVKKVKDTVNVEATEIIYEDTAVLPPGPRNRFGSIGTLSTLPKIKALEKMDNYHTVAYFEIIKWCKPQWFLLIIGSIASLIGGAALPIVCIFFGELFGLLSLTDFHRVQKETDIYAWILVFVGLGAGICVFLQMYCFAAAGAKLTSFLRIKAFRSIIHQEIAFFDQDSNKVGVLCHRLAKEPSDVQGSIGIRLGVVIQGFSTMTIGIAISAFINWKITLVALATIPFVFTGVYLESVFSKSVISAQGRSAENASKIAVEVFNSIKVVAGLGVESYFIEKYSAAVKEIKKANTTKAWLRGFAFAIGQTAPFFGYAVTLWYGGILIAQEDLHYKYVIMVSELLIFGAWTLGQSVVVGPSFARSKIAASKLKAIFTRKPVIADGDVDLITEMPKENFITYEKVWFAYPTRPGISVLQNFSLNIKSGASIALVGPNGCGKSTTVQLLLRFYDCTSGIITIDDMDIRDYRLSSLRKRLGFVPQEPVLFDRTIEENIAYGDNSRKVPMREIIEAAELADIHSFIISLPEGYDTKLGPSGTQLSGGQKQRIAIARVLVRNPQILILDEATSALDPKSEANVQKALNKASEERTTISIGHRLSAIMNSDIIYVLDKGLIKEFGSHKELIKLKGLYFSIFNSEAADEINNPGPSTN